MIKSLLKYLPKNLIQKYMFRPPNPSTYIFEDINESYYLFKLKDSHRNEIINKNVHGYILKENNAYFIPLIHMQSHKCFDSHKTTTNSPTKLFVKNDNTSKSATYVYKEQRNKKVIIFSHGNASDLGDVYYFAENICDKYDIDFIAYDYTGYGLGVNNFHCTEKQTYIDLQQVIAYTVLKLGYAIEDIFLWGFSIGSGPSVELATRFTSLAGLILQSPLASIYNIFEEGEYKSDMFVNINKIDKVYSSIFIIHSQNDEIVPYRHTEMLYNKYVQENGGNGKIQATQLSTVNHNDSLYLVQNRKLCQQIQNFLTLKGQRQELEYELLLQLKFGEKKTQYWNRLSDQFRQSVNNQRDSTFCLCVCSL